MKPFEINIILIIYNLYCFLFVFLFSIGILTIWDKYDLTNRVVLFSQHLKIKFFYNLFNCRFCTEHLIMVFSTVLWCCMYYFTFSHVFIPLLAVSLLQVIKRLSK